MTTLLDLIRQRRAQLETTGLEHLGPITDVDRVRAIRMCVADALHDPAAAELVRKLRAIGPEVAALIDEIEAEMQEEAKAKGSVSPKPRVDDELAWAMRFVTKHGGSVPSDKGR
jgi:transposase